MAVAEQSQQLEAVSKALPVAVNILSKWKATADQMAAILGVSSATIARAKRKSHVTLTRDQADRVSYVLNIHQALRIVFDNPENVYGFVHKKNHNPYFNGATPFELMVKGSMANLYEVFKRIDALRGAQW
ncbi:MbcA/ParS/Xre antitoxin family protein [Alteromonas sp. ASW11-19]|uniref:MbcA/ParS/Xre antitoxin family protein n=1 Tax=Alteromonas salexigens TaxID=2982530 RepID=A0ABT2VUG9_9ALTE|nr:MbcA/ParS/Xre antitoxin family protein [Alteromonas salexigens]MCU7556078.1 MbcA/ParS/Xre antitoxin family protein [Alteromonas salexigens]